MAVGRQERECPALKGCDGTEGAFVEGDPLQLLYLFLGSATSPYRSAREIELLTGRTPNSEQAIKRHIELCERLFFRTQPAQTAT